MLRLLPSYKAAKGCDGIMFLWGGIRTLSLGRVLAYSSAPFGGLLPLLTPEKALKFQLPRFFYW